MKSRRLAASWETKRTKATGGHKMTHRIPAWLRLVNRRLSTPELIHHRALRALWQLRADLNARERESRRLGRVLPTPACLPDPDARGGGAGAHLKRASAIPLGARRGSWRFFPGAISMGPGRTRSTVCDLVDRHGLVRKAWAHRRVGHPASLARISHQG
jgi:hypothetical protein